MANVLPKEKQVAIIAALAEGNSIRSVERMTNVHRDTIMRLAVKVGEGCEKLLDEKMNGLKFTFLALLTHFLGIKMVTNGVPSGPIKSVYRG